MERKVATFCLVLNLIVLINIRHSECRELKISAVDVSLTDEGDRYAARVAIDTIMDNRMVAKAAWQIYHKSIIDDVLYQVPVPGSLDSDVLNITSFIGQLEPGSPLTNLVQAESKDREMVFNYIYSVADAVSRTGITFTEFIDTARTKSTGTPLARLNTRELEPVEVYIGEQDTGQKVVEAGQPMYLECSYKSKYKFRRQWTWDRIAMTEDALSSGNHPLQHETIAQSNLEQEIDEYVVTTREMDTGDGYVFVTRLFLISFDPARHTGLYHCSINDYSMLSAGQPWLLTIDKFTEVRPVHTLSTQTLALPRYVAIETCSKKGPDSSGAIWLRASDPDCIVCMTLGSEPPVLMKDGSPVPGSTVWPLTVRNPFLHLVYVVFSRPAAQDAGRYTCLGGHTEEPQQTSFVVRIAPVDSMTSV